MVRTSHIWLLLQLSRLYSWKPSPHALLLQAVCEQEAHKDTLQFSVLISSTEVKPVLNYEYYCFLCSGAVCPAKCGPIFRRIILLLPSELASK
jgi:hypothetical protein